MKIHFQEDQINRSLHVSEYQSTTKRENCFIFFHQLRNGLMEPKNPLHMASSDIYFPAVCVYL